MTQLSLLTPWTLLGLLQIRGKPNKKGMACGVALPSLATLLTPWDAATSLWALLAMWFLLGVAEGVALPCMNNMVARWFPQSERTRAVGIAMVGFQLGSAIGLTLSPTLMSQGGLFGFWTICDFWFVWISLAIGLVVCNIKYSTSE